MPNDAANPAAMPTLETAFSDAMIAGDKRVAAEVAYALANRYRVEDRNGRRRFDLAKTWAIRSIELLSELPSETLDQVVSTRPSVGGVPMPDLLHAEVVRERLADVLI